MLHFLMKIVWNTFSRSLKNMITKSLLKELVKNNEQSSWESERLWSNMPIIFFIILYFLMKKSTLIVIISVILINLSAYIYETKFNTCTDTTWAWAERLIEVCTDKAVKLSKRHDELTAKQKTISTKANLYRDVRDKKVSNINLKIKEDVVFHKGQK